MEPNVNRTSDPKQGPIPPRRLAWLLIAAAIIILIGLICATKRDPKAPDANSPGATGAVGHSDPAGVTHAGPTRALPQRSHPSQPRTAEEIVAAKVIQFGRNRRELVREIARRLNKDVPSDVERFFDAIEAGNWEDIAAQWQQLAKHSGQYEFSTNHWPELDPFWSSVLDAYGVAEQAHEWPSQELLDYGQAILNSLRPGMVYVGGTDNGRWVPELLNETSDGEHHVILTQNALADARYLEFLNTLYGNRMTTLTMEDSKRAFEDYTADAARRFEHDQQYPDEPKQVLPGEGIKMVDGRVQVSGQVAVMAVNERLLQMFMQKNPDLSFAMEESFSLRGLYADAAPLGPILELRAQDGPNTFTPERASQSVDLWRNRTEQMLTGNSPSLSQYALRSYSHDASATANLLAAHNYATEAEQTYQMATRFWPANPEPVGGLADLLMRNGRNDEARQILENFSRQYPGKQKDLERISAAWTLTGPAQTGAP